MKTNNIIIAMMLMLSTVALKAQTLRVNEINTTSGGEMVIQVVASDDINKYVAAGFCIELPDGFSLAGLEGEKSVNVKSDHIVRVGKTNDNKIRVAVYSLSNSEFNLDLSVPMFSKAGESDTTSIIMGKMKAPVGDIGLDDIPLVLCTLRLKAPYKSGTFSGKMSAIELATNQHELIKKDACSFGITIQDQYDVNNDGTIDTQDVLRVYYIMRISEPDSPVGKEDINHDGIIDTQDILKIYEYMQDN